MAFDWTTVEGFREDMTADEKIALLENYTAPEKPEPTAPENPEPAPAPRNGYVAKTQFDKLSSELAAAKKQLRSRMSEDEQKEADRAAEMQAKEEELASLRREKALSSHKASFLGQGYDEQLAEEAATAMVDGDMDGVFAAMKRFNAANEKALRARILSETPVPPSSDDPNDTKKKEEDLRKLRGYFGLPV